MPVMRLVVSNNWVHAYDVDPQLAHSLNLELRYPTAQVRITGGHFANPQTGWDGWVRLLRPRKDGYAFPTGLLGRAVRHARRMGFAYAIDDKRVRPPLGTPWCEAALAPLYDYQEAAVEKALAAGRGVIDSPPRSGKTRLATELIRRLALPCVWTAPTDRIVKQTVGALGDVIGAHNVMHLVGSQDLAKAIETPVVVCTVATVAAMLPKNKWRTPKHTPFFDSRRVLVVDEWHHAAAASYRALFIACEHVFFRYGLTGTHFRSGDDAMAMQALLSNTVFKITTADLVKRGRLVPLDIVFVATEGPMLRGAGRDFIGGFGKLGAFEHLGRNRQVAEAAAALAKAGRRVLVIIRTKAQGRLVTAMIQALLGPKKPGCQFAPVEFVSTDAPRRRIDAILDSYTQLQEIRVLVGTSLIGEGTDLPVADALVYAAAGHAEVSLLQNAFRVATAVAGKPARALIVDFTDRHCRKLMDQAQHRLKHYHAEPVFKVQYQESVAALMAWLKQAHPPELALQAASQPP